MHQIHTNIANGIDFLEAEQLKNGGFVSFSSPFLNRFLPSATQYQTIFTPALILHCLNTARLHYHQSDIIRPKIASYLLKQKSEQWSFNYWQRNSPEASARPLPDDLDDTFCSLSALSTFDQNLITPEVLAHSTRLLLDCESKPGGPYRTWLVPGHVDARWHDVDIAVNSNIAYFLALRGITLPSLVDLQKTAIGSGQFQSPYYPSAFPLLYFIGRSYAGDRSGVVQFLSKSRNAKGYWQSPLSTALAITALLSCGQKPHMVEDAVQYLLKTQRRNGSWPAYGFCIDPAQDGKTYYAGSPALTTAFCVEALACYETSLQKLSAQSKRTAVSPIDTREAQIVNRSLGLLRFRQARANAWTQKLIGRLLDGSQKQVALLPYWTTLAIGSSARHIKQTTLIDLGTASLLGWIAYDIYDDFFDNEATTLTLPIANRALRSMTALFAPLRHESAQFAFHFDSIMEQLEQANMTEITGQNRFHRTSRHRSSIPIIDSSSANRERKLEAEASRSLKRKRGLRAEEETPTVRSREFHHLCDKSLGHCLSALAVLYTALPDVPSRDVDHLIAFFRHYLNARQLYDDMHDWEADLNGGRLTEVVQFLIYDTRAGSGQLSSATIPPNVVLRQRFWNHTVLRMNELLASELAKAEQRLKEIAVFDSPQYFEQFLTSLRHVVRETNRKQSQTRAFIDAFRKVP